ncbi:MAG: peptide ABC transporter substrate-binding protein [Candidatus Paceibacterota bacterium]
MHDFKLPKKAEINTVLSSFSKKEKNIFLSLLIILSISTLFILQGINQHFMVSVPTPGGSVSEGIVGAPRFINPVLAFSDTDRDMVTLIYSGLMRKTGDGELSLDLAEKYEVSPDKLSYTFTLKEGTIFHDGESLDADDVIFTIQKVKDSVLKSPEKSAWDGVTVEKVDDRTIIFTLRQPYSSFLGNTTLGILPEHIWNQSLIELNTANTNPIGSGPFMIKTISRQESGIINSYELIAFPNFALGKPYLENISIRFYPNEKDVLQALKNKEITQLGSIDPENALDLEEENYRVEATILPRIFGIFFNHNQNQIFLNKTVVRAINDAIDKDRIISEVLSGYGVAIDDPIPPNMSDYQNLAAKNEESRADILEKVEASLAKDGWKKNVDGFLEKTTTVNKKKTTTLLEFTISTGNAPELSKSAELIQEDLAKVGIKVEIKTFEIGNLNQSVIRPRKYDALLFGQIINHESDLYAFWHSSQRKDPGLNVSSYTNAKVDKILEDAFITLDAKAREKKYAEFETEIKKDMPAVFLYSPKFIYVVPENLEGLVMNRLVTPGERFGNVHQWYTNTDNVWELFSKKD